MAALASAISVVDFGSVMLKLVHLLKLVVVVIVVLLLLLLSSSLSSVGPMSLELSLVDA